MNSFVTAIVALTLCLADPAFAGNHKSKVQGADTLDVSRSVRNCPPGLAKKSPACVPPGLAKKGFQRDYRIGDILDRDHDRWRDHERYDVRLRDGERFYRRDDVIYRVERNTREILDIIRLADLLTN